MLQTLKLSIQFVSTLKKASFSNKKNVIFITCISCRCLFTPVFWTLTNHWTGSISNVISITWKWSICVDRVASIQLSCVVIYISICQAQWTTCYVYNNNIIYISFTINFKYIIYRKTYWWKFIHFMSIIDIQIAENLRIVLNLWITFLCP